MTRSVVRSIVFGLFASIGANPNAYGQTDPYEARPILTDGPDTVFRGPRFQENMFKFIFRFLREERGGKEGYEKQTQTYERGCDRGQYG